MPLPPPDHDLRPGARGVATARLVILAILCGLQYWLLTSTMEAFHSGDRRLPAAAALASVACFLLQLGLVFTAEVNEARRLRHHREGEKS